MKTISTDQLCSSDEYLKMSSELLEKYGPFFFDEDYPEEYWIEFNQRCDEIRKKLEQE